MTLLSGRETPRYRRYGIVAQRICYIRSMRLRLIVWVLLSAFMGAKAQERVYYFSKQIDSLLVHDTLPYKFQAGSWYYSFIGNHQKALEVKDKQFPNAKPAQPTAEQRALLARYSPVAAQDRILAEAKNRRLLILNEAHYMAPHRLFVLSMLKELRAMGYTHLGLEALNHDDSLLNQRKYAVTQTGLYTHEPAFGRLIREALELGFVLFAYEQRFNDSLQQQQGRELAQAMNVKMVMDASPKARIVLLCGYDHAVEDTLRGFMGLPMAGQLKQLTGEDPFTVDQTALSEYHVVGSRYRKLMDLTYSALFVDSVGQYFNSANPAKRIDCHVYHPNTVYVKNRPSWLLRPNMRLVGLRDKITIRYPCLVKILVAGETADAIPVDVIELLSADDPTASLVYKRRKQYALVENPYGEQQRIPIR